MAGGGRAAFPERWVTSHPELAPCGLPRVHAGRAVDTVLLVQQALVFTSAGRRPAPPNEHGWQSAFFKKHKQNEKN